MALFCFIVSFWRLPPAQDGPERQKGQSAEFRELELNLFGVVSFGILIAGVMTLCHRLGRSGTQNCYTIAIHLSVVVISGIAYGWNERFWTEAPLIPLDIIKNNQVWAIYLAQFLVYFSGLGVWLAR